tara:strand:- start:49 stop:561 length:513 start_codon:yes stop_codon:yes gene_type:complete
MLIFNKKKKELNNIYNKIVEESKVSYYLLKTGRSNTDHLREVFQMNLILILWYMKTKNISKKYLEYLIKIFIKDLEGMVIELGGSETSLRKKIRKFIENFYGRLYAFSELFDNFENGGEKKLKDVINKNLKSPLITKLMIGYLSLNYSHLKKLDEKDFWRANLFKDKLRI